jgi:hypothetical protein
VYQSGVVWNVSVRRSWSRPVMMIRPVSDMMREIPPALISLYSTYLSTCLGGCLVQSDREHALGQIQPPLIMCHSPCSARSTFSTAHHLYA